MIIPIIYKMTIKHFEKKYQVDGYTIKEIFNIKNKIHYYDYIITKGKEKYSYTIENSFHKKGNVIKEVKSYKEKNVQCILPMYKNDKELDLYCLLDKQQVSQEVLKENENYKKIVKKVKQSNIKVLKENTTKKEYKNMIVYSKNIPEKEALIVWNYKGINVIRRGEETSQAFLKDDLYDNIMATTTSRYFVLFENTSVNGIENIHIYDMENDKYSVWKLKEKFSKNSYINGVVNDLIYITDKENKKQFTMNVQKRQITEVGNEEKLFILFQNGEKTLMSKSDFLMNYQYFKNVRVEKKKITTSNDMVEEDNYDYFQEDGSFYKQMNGANRILLFTLEGVEEWNVFDKEIILKKEDSVYLYSDKAGLRKIIEYNELNYNYKNIVYLWK